MPSILVAKPSQCGSNGRPRPCRGARLHSLDHAVGNTPLLELALRVDGREFTVYAKQESCNLTGSIKDRMALFILQDAYARGLIHPGDLIIEATSGNTGIAFAAIGRAIGHPVRIYMPSWMSRERRLLVESLGAEIVLVTPEQGGFLGSIALADAYARDHGHSFRPSQFDSAANVAAHARSTAPELLRQLAAIGKQPTAFVAGVGTGGTVMGVKHGFALAGVGAAIHPLEPANSPTLRRGHREGNHRIQGISDEFVPAIVDLAQLDRIIDVWDGDAILMAQRLSHELGLGVGISSGANLLGAIQIALEQGESAVVTTVFADCNKKYLSTALCDVEPVRDDYLSPRVELVDFRVLARP